MATDTQTITDLVEHIADTIVTPRFRSLEDDQIIEKLPGDLVTIADRQAEEAFTARLLELYPDAQVVGEEAAFADASLLDGLAQAEHGFVIDPVDGTKNFVHGSPDHAVMLAEVRDGLVTRTWVYQPQHQAMFVAERGAGAFRNGQRLEALHQHDPVQVLSSRRGLRGRMPLGPEASDQVPVHNTHGSCGIDYPALASGRCDGLIYAKNKPWDHLPGELLLHETGGALLTWSGDPYTVATPVPSGLVAAASLDLARRVIDGLGLEGVPAA